jgi:hypothetical protein
MPQRANIRGSFVARMAIVGLGCFGFMSWCLFDGLVTYPNQRERALKYIDVKRDGGANWKQEWEDYAKERGWSDLDPKEPKKEGEFTVQFIMATAAGTGALIFLFLALRNRGRWIEGDETGLSTSWGHRCPWDSIFELNKKKWRNKGIAVVRYDQDGSKKRIVLDDCKYDIEGTEALLREVESRLRDDQIVGGPPEPPPESESDQDDAEASQEPDEVAKE